MSAPSCACGCGEPAWKWMLGQRCAYLLAGACAGKTWFTHEETAVARRSRAQDTYLCKVCNHWHNGAAGGATAEIQIFRERVIDGLRRNGYPLAMLAEGFKGMDRIGWKHGRVTR